MLSLNKILYALAFSILIVFFYNFFTLLKLDTFTMLLSLTLMMTINQVLAYSIAYTNPKEGMNHALTVLVYLISVQFVSLFILWIYLTNGVHFPKKYFRTEDIFLILTLLGFLLPSLVTLSLWFFSIRHNKPKF